MERRVDVKPSGAFQTIGVHFRPAGAAAFVSGDLSRFTNRIQPLAPAIGEDLGPLVAVLKSARTPTRQAGLIERFLRRRLCPGDPAMAVVASRLSADSGIADLLVMARRFRLSERQLRRRFSASVGLGPKRFARIVRFQRVFEQRLEHDARAWSEVALDCGYYDQAHFNRDFRAFTGVRPRDIVRDADPLTAFFLTVSSKTADPRRG
jgi:AraC-like DNA-binding protein